MSTCISSPPSSEVDDFVRAALPLGTTAAAADPHEIANVFVVAGFNCGPTDPGVVPEAASDGSDLERLGRLALVLRERGPICS
jgi:hypothetical protein